MRDSFCRGTVPFARAMAAAVCLLWAHRADCAGSCPSAVSSDAWKETITAYTDPFLAFTVPGGPPWAKFTILVCAPSRVYFQDSGRYPFHYDFLREHFSLFASLSPEEFEAVTMRGENQQAVLGAVLFPPRSVAPSGRPAEYGIQLIRHTPYSCEELLTYLEAVRRCVIAPEGTAVLYLPSFEQRGAAEACRAELEHSGVLVDSVERWSRGNRVYADGWALGRLKFFPAQEARSAFLRGELLPEDILLTDGVLPQTPLVGGVVSLGAVAPNSHPVILAATFGVPLVYVASPGERRRAQELLGHRVVLRAYHDPYRPDVRLIDIERTVTAAQVEELRSLGAVQELSLDPVEPLGRYVVSVEDLDRDAVRYVGGKAANFGYLRRWIPDNSPQAAAITFDLFLQFMEQEIAPGETLRARIERVLSPYRWPVSDMQQLARDLAELRDFFLREDQTSFTPVQREVLLVALRDPQFGFDPTAKLRFRSSTNVEDTERFTGAGLYESKSGCLADDLDLDSEGPSRCDPSKQEERGVFRAIRRVFASFYNEKAVLARLRYSVPEQDVGMALLVHHSFPDEIELANGVGTVRRRGLSVEILMVTQKGAVAVTNPPLGAVPEEVTAWVDGGRIHPQLLRPSNLVLLGATVLRWPEEYRELGRLLAAATEGYLRETGKENVVLDFEYKKVAPEGRLVIKQLREIPQPDRTRLVTPFLINEPLTYKTYEGNYGTVFANLRLKTYLTAETRSMYLTAGNLAEGLYTDVELVYSDGCRVRSVWGSLGELPNYRRVVEGQNFIEEWDLPFLPNPRHYTFLTEGVPLEVTGGACPVLTQRDIGQGVRKLTVRYRKPVLSVDEFHRELVWVTEESVLLEPVAGDHTGDLIQTRTFEESSRGLSITARFTWPPVPPGPIAGYTAPVSQWLEASIGGLDSAPFLLQSPFAQAYRPWQHNFDEYFLFVPLLEGRLTGEQRAALTEQGVYAVYAVRRVDGQREVRVFSVQEAGTLCDCPGGEFIRGDANGDGRIEISDPIAVLAYLFLSGTLPQTPHAADANSDGLVDIADAIFLLEYLFRHGPAPGPPYPEPGCIGEQ